ncbi:tyrosine-type recombinase/integrase [Oricola indica]|uniref:tyrosine-type recombinase/integrase n=1 Tax=Oricola indica TaxID=2872591 RepID=UPI003CCBB13E
MSKRAPKPKGLPAHVSVSKTGVYRYRRRVPGNLVETIGKREVKESLGKDYGAALRRHAVIQAGVEKLFAQKPRKNSNAEIKVLSKLREYSLDLQAVAAAAREGVDPDQPDDLTYAIDAAIEELERDPEIPPEFLRNAAKGILTVTLAGALDDYCEYRKTGQPISDRVIERRTERHKERLARYLGRDAVNRRPLSNLRRTDARRVVEALINETSPATARRYLNDINAAVNRAILEYDLDCANPFMRLDTKGGKHTRDNRLPLDDDDMKALAPIMETDDDLGTIWITLRDTGARLNEIVGLRGCDVDERRKTVWIRPHEARPIKTDNSNREIPIPDAVLERLMAHKGKTSEAPLFPRYVRERGNDACSQTLMKRLRKAVKEPRKTAYSLRHRMKDMLRDADCPEDLAREIMGHSDQSSAANYGRGSSLERKRAALEKVWDN